MEKKVKVTHQMHSDTLTKWVLSQFQWKQMIGLSSPVTISELQLTFLIKL